MDQAAIEKAAATIAAARLERRRLGRLPDDLRPPDPAAAYRIQDAVHVRLIEAGRGPLVGYKIGCTTEVMQRYLGIPSPCAGGMMAGTVVEADGRFAAADFLHPAMECEIAVRLGQDLPGRGDPHDRASVGAAVEAVMASIEFVDDRYEDFRSLDTPTLIADDFFQAGCVLGPPCAGWRTLDLASVTGRASRNGTLVGEGRGGDILGHPFEALAWLANHQNQRGTLLRAGTVVTLGSVVETVWLEPGDRIEIAFDGLGSAGLELI